MTNRNEPKTHRAYKQRGYHALILLFASEVVRRLAKYIEENGCGWKQARDALAPRLGLDLINEDVQRARREAAARGHKVPKEVTLRGLQRSILRQREARSRELQEAIAAFREAAAAESSFPQVDRSDL
ncbi:MAG TPA: hypothetical protein PKD61_09740 [Polyangiaceae bacterium]|nr:hypothetical protein [Polyangiaceae bacterium]